MHNKQQLGYNIAHRQCQQHLHPQQQKHKPIERPISKQKDQNINNSNISTNTNSHLFHNNYQSKMTQQFPQKSAGNSVPSLSRQSLKKQIGDRLNKFAQGTNSSVSTNHITTHSASNINNCKTIASASTINRNSSNFIYNKKQAMPNMLDTVKDMARQVVPGSKLKTVRNKQLSIIIQGSTQAQQKPQQSSIPQNQSAQVLPQQQQKASTQTNNFALNHMSSLKRNNSNNSIISELEEIQAYEMYEEKEKDSKDPRCDQKLIIKVADGIYIGGQDSIWDLDTMALNYVTHLIRICIYDTTTHQSIKQQYVPQTISYIHTVQYHQSQQIEQKKIMQTFKKINQFIQHAQQQGQSCILITKNLSKSQRRSQEKEGQPQELGKPRDHDQGRQRDTYGCVYKPAGVVCGYLMYRYSWSMLKSIQFVSSRLNAAHKTTQILSKINKKIGKNTGSRHIPNNNHNHNLYSQVITHMLPELVHPSVNQQLPNVSFIPKKSLERLEKMLIDLESRQISYGWVQDRQRSRDRSLSGDNVYMNKYLEDQFNTLKEEELVLTNTYINCTFIDNMSYTNLLQSESKSQQKRPTSQDGLRDHHARSSINLRTKGSEGGSSLGGTVNVRNSISGGTIHQKKPLKIFPNAYKDSSLRSSIQKNSNMNIGKRKQIQTELNMSKSVQLRQQGTSILNLDKKGLNEMNSHSCVLVKSNNKNKKQKKHVKWSNLLTVVHREQDYRQSVENYRPQISNNKNSINNSNTTSMLSSIKYKEEPQILKQYADNIKNKYTIKLSAHQTTNNSPQKVTSTNNNTSSNIPKPIGRDDTNEGNTANIKGITINKAKIVVNVIDIISRHSQNNTQRERQKQGEGNQHRFANTKKSKIYKSKAKLPTMQDLLVTNTTNSSANPMINNESDLASYGSQMMARKKQQNGEKQSSHNQNTSSHNQMQIAEKKGNRRPTIDTNTIYSEGNQKPNHRRQRKSVQSKIVIQDMKQSEHQHQQSHGRSKSTMNRHLHTENNVQCKNYLQQENQQFQYKQQDLEHASKSIDKIRQITNDSTINCGYKTKEKIISQTISKLKQIKNNRHRNSNTSDQNHKFKQTNTKAWNKSR